MSQKERYISCKWCKRLILLIDLARIYFHFLLKLRFWKLKVHAYTSVALLACREGRFHMSQSDKRSFRANHSKIQQQYWKVCFWMWDGVLTNWCDLCRMNWIRNLCKSGWFTRQNQFRVSYISRNSFELPYKTFCLPQTIFWGFVFNCFTLLFISFNTWQHTVFVYNYYVLLCFDLGWK